MKLPIALVAAILLAIPASADPAAALESFASYQQGEPLAVLIDTREAILHGTEDQTTRAERERMLIDFIAADDAHLQAKAIAISWLGIVGSEKSIPALTEAAKTPALKEPAAAALARIPEAADARIKRETTPLPPPTAKATAAAALIETLNTDISNQAALRSILEALRSPDDLLAVIATREIRTRAKASRLAEELIEHLGAIPTARRARVFNALASRGDAGEPLRDALLARVKDGDVAALPPLRHVMRAEEVPMVLALTQSEAFAEAAELTLARATHPSINGELADIATAGGGGAVAAINALASRHAIDVTEILWTITTGEDEAMSTAAYRALGSITPPADLPALLDKLIASHGRPSESVMQSLAWNVIRRHPNPGEAADLLEKRATDAPTDVQPLLRRYAERIRPKD